VQLQALFNYDHLYIGGGNASRIDFELPPHVTRVPNDDGLLGAAALWRDPTHLEAAKASAVAKDVLKKAVKKKVAEITA
jgi:hypothetical protein